MKKFLSFVLIASMMLSVSALGEEAVGSAVIQDEQPPVLVTTLTEANEVVAANICDAQGNVIDTIMDDGSLVLTDVHHRTVVENETIKTRLTTAYENVMEDVHHSDVACELHDHDVKVDINMVLDSLNNEIDAHDLVMYELFDVNFSDVAEAFLVDGSYVELTLALKEFQPLPLIVLFSGNGIDWTVIPYTSEDGQKITVNLKESGTIALLCDGHEVLGIGEEVEDDIIIPTEGDDSETESPNFTPSVSGKPAPEIETFTGEDGETYIGTIGSNDTDEKVFVPNRNYVLVTAVAERDNNFDIQTHEHLEWGYDGILEAEDVGDLMADNHEGIIAADLDAVLAEMGLDLTHEQLIVKDLFEVTAYGDYLHYLYDENYYLELTFATDLDPAKAVVVIHSPDSVHWHIHPIEEAIVHDNGQITLRMYDLGAVALLVEKAETIPEDAVTSPE